MKILIVTLTLLSVFASEASPFPVRGTQLDQMKINKAHFSEMRVSSADISIDYSNKMVRLNASGTVKNLPARCNLPNGPECMRFTSRNVDIKITKDVTTLCTRTITAEKDQRPVDGIKQTIVVTEFAPARNARCMKRLPTTVTYTTLGFSRLDGIEKGGTSTFSGPALEVLMTTIPVEGPFIP